MQWPISKHLLLFKIFTKFHYNNPCISVDYIPLQSNLKILLKYWLSASGNLEILGGSDDTRNAFRRTRSSKALKKLLDEGRKQPVPIKFHYISLPEIIKIKYPYDTVRLKKAKHLEQYYKGYLDFGCTRQPSEYSDRNLRWFASASS